MTRFGRAIWNYTFGLQVDLCVMVDHCRQRYSLVKFTHQVGQNRTSLRIPATSAWRSARWGTRLQAEVPRFEEGHESADQSK